MTRGKIQIKFIENQTNRQVTYSKRRNGLFKKAKELSILCDAKVSIILISKSSKLTEYISPNITTKQLFDEYQKAKPVDLWSSHYEKMQGELKGLNELNRSLRRQIRQRTGESLNGLTIEQTVHLIDEIEDSLKPIREKKYKVIGNQIDTRRKKVRNEENINRDLSHECDVYLDDPHYGLVDNEGDPYNPVFGIFPDGVPRIIALHPPHNHHANHHHPSFHSGGGSALTTFALLE